MKKKITILFFVVLIIANVFLATPTTPTRGKKTNLELVQLQARADGPEIDPPGDDYPPTRVQPNIFMQIIEFFF